MVYFCGFKNITYNSPTFAALTVVVIIELHQNCKEQSSFKVAKNAISGIQRQWGGAPQNKGWGRLGEEHEF